MNQRVNAPLFKPFEDTDLENLIQKGFLYYVTSPSLDPELEDEDPTIDTLLLIPCKQSQEAGQIRKLLGAGSHVYSAFMNRPELYEATLPYFGVRFLIPCSC